MILKHAVEHLNECVEGLCSKYRTFLYIEQSVTMTARIRYHDFYLPMVRADVMTVVFWY